MKIDPNELPTVEDVHKLVRGILKSLYAEDYDKFVLEEGSGHFIIITKGYLYYPPINITIGQHPDDESKALFVQILRKIPIENEKEIAKLAKISGGVFSIGLDEIVRDYGDGKEHKIRFVTLTARLHSFSIKDTGWFFLTLSKFIKMDDILLGGLKKVDEFPIERKSGAEKGKEIDFT